jgi:hypothetical protein
MSGKLRGNQCPKCAKTQEECADKNVCPNSDVSLEVCRQFGTRTVRRPLPTS